MDLSPEIPKCSFISFNFRANTIYMIRNIDSFKLFPKLRHGWSACAPVFLALHIPSPAFPLMVLLHQPEVTAMNPRDIRTLLHGSDLQISDRNSDELSFTNIWPTRASHRSMTRSLLVSSKSMSKISKNRLHCPPTWTTRNGPIPQSVSFPWWSRSRDCRRLASSCFWGSCHYKMRADERNRASLRVSEMSGSPRHWFRPRPAELAAPRIPPGDSSIHSQSTTEAQIYFSRLCSANRGCL
jgi:hypothetical protein